MFTIFGDIYNFFKKNKVGFIGITLAIIFFIINIYFVFYTPQPKITYTILSDSNIVDLHKPLRDLKILFQDEDIQKNNLNLKIYSLKISNSGKKNILETHYASDVDWGIKITEGKIIESRLVESNSDYLKEKLNPKIVDDKIINFKKVIFDKNDYFILEVLVLHSRDSDINLIPFGRISGISKNQAFKKLDTTRGKMFQDVLINSLLLGLVFILATTLIMSQFLKTKERKIIEKTISFTMDRIDTKLSSSRKKTEMLIDLFYDDIIQEALSNNPCLFKRFKDCISQIDSSNNKL